MSSAAPGVDHATMIGARYHSESPMQIGAMPMDNAHIHEEICASVRPAACPAWNISTRERV